MTEPCAVQEAIRWIGREQAARQLGYRLSAKPAREAEAFREGSIRLEPVSGIAHYNLANVLQSTKRLAESLKRIREAIRIADAPLPEMHNDTAWRCAARPLPKQGRLSRRAAHRA